jgi:hypothetical protein
MRQFRVSRPLWLPSAAALLAYLRDRGATFVALEHANLVASDRYSDAKEWVTTDRRHFRLLMRDDSFSYYRVVR